MPYMQNSDMTSLRKALEIAFYLFAGCSIFGGFLLEIVCVMPSKGKAIYDD